MMNWKQIGRLAIAPVLALEVPEPDVRTVESSRTGDGSAPELLYVLNLVRTKQDKTLPRYVFFS